MVRFKNPIFILSLIFVIFLALFIAKSVVTMVNVPLYDFDEAHRAENAKRMAEYKSYFVPLTGSPQDRVLNLKTPYKENPDFYLYYHLERPPLVYILMFASANFFGPFEWAYRLPSFLFGMLIILSFLFFSRKEKGNLFAVSVGFLSLICSSDLWLSAQYAQMDTGITFFLTLSLLTLLYFVEKQKDYLIYLSGLFFGLALLSKLQPAIIFIFPLIGLLILKKIKFVDLFKFALGFLIIFLPWIIHVMLTFDLPDVIKIMPGFALDSASVISIHQKAPFFWYVRWWWESFRPGWTIFLAFVLYDLFVKNFTWKKIILLFYIFGGLLAFSLPVNKIWWYVLPLIPAVCYYIFLSVNDYILKEQETISKFSFIMIFASLPLFLKSSNSLSLLYGISITTIIFLILINKLNIKLSFKKRNTMLLFFSSIIICLFFFSLNFPKIIPYHANTKEVALFYRNLPYPKCLWLGDMPGEAVLFYSNAGEVPILNQTNQNSQVFTNCKNNYLITPQRYREGELIFGSSNIRLYQLTQDSKKID